MLPNESARDRIASAAGKQERRALLTPLGGDGVAELLEASTNQRQESVHGCMRDAFLAVELARALLSERIPEADKLLARALGHLGNAQRILGDLDAANDSMEQAAVLLATTTDAPSLAEHLEFSTSLLHAERRLPEALARARSALDLHRAALDTVGMARCKIQVGVIHEHTGTPRDGVPALIDAVGMLREAHRKGENPEEVRRLMRSAGQVLVCRLIEAEEHAEALETLRSMERLFEEAPAMDRLKIDWLRAKVERALGLLGSARASFGRLQRAYLDRGMPYDAALATLDGIRTELDARNTPGVRRLVGDLRELLSALGIGDSSTAVALAGRLLQGRQCTDQLEGFLIRLAPIGQPIIASFLA